MLATYVPVYFILAQTIHLNYWNMIQKAVKCVKKILLMLTYCIWSKRCCCWQLVACISSSPAAVIVILISKASVLAVDNGYHVHSFLNAN